jgi:D-beta-D-heptose 7-phosphate kinase/D-beta-D-heptose 1-phosphate adenosyltransferase
VLVVGDYLVDRYWVGECSRVSPEAPIPVVRITKTFDLPGGAGNVGRNLKSLGCDVWTLPGNHDHHPIKNRLMVGDVQLARWDEQDFCEATPPFRYVEDIYSGVSAVVVADYLKGSITPDLLEIISEWNLPTFVDTKGDPSPYLVNFRDVTVFPNLKEYTAHRDIYNQFKTCVLKKGPDGIDLLKYGVLAGSVPSKARFVRSVNGAGDTVVAAFLAAKLKGLRSPLEYAAWAAGSVVEQPYTATPVVSLNKEFHLSDLYAA